MNFLLRVYSFLFLLPLTLFFFGMGSFALLEGAYDLKLPMLPWSGAALTYWIFGLSLAGLVSMVLAIRKTARLLYALYAVAVFGLVVYATFLSNHRYGGVSDFQWALGMCAAALGAAMGAVVQARRRA